MKKIITILSITLLFLTSCGKRDTETVVLTAPFGPLAYPFIRMAAEDGPVDYELVVWKNPDQLKAMIAGSQADFFSLPSNVAAIFHNKGAGLSLAAVSLWKVMWIVSNDSGIHTLADLKGETIVMPFKGDMPHILFSSIVRGLGLDPERDFNLSFVASPQDASRQLLTGAADHAFLAEPDLSILIRKAADVDGQDGAPQKFYRAVDIQEAWAGLNGGAGELPIGSVAVTENARTKTGRLDSFRRDYRKAVEWCSTHPDEVALMVAEYFPGVEPEGVADSMKHIVLRYENAAGAREALESFYSVIREGNPARIGGELPGDDFYLSGE